MSGAMRRAWLSIRHEGHLVDVSDGALVKGPGGYYVPADVHDETVRQRDRLLETLKALFENTPEGDDFFYDYGTRGGEHWCEVCGASAEDYVRVAHESDCIVGAAEAAIAECEGGKGDG